LCRVINRFVIGFYPKITKLVGRILADMFVYQISQFALLVFVRLSPCDPLLQCRFIRNKLANRDFFARRCIAECV